MSQSDFVNRGQALVSAGQYQEAVKVCRLGLLGRPTTVDGRVVLGQALLALKRFDEVLAEMRVALELDHSAIPAHALKGEALLRKGDRHGAIEALERARSIAPNDPAITSLLMEASQVPAGPGMSAAMRSSGAYRAQDAMPEPPLFEPDTEDPEGDEYTRPGSLRSQKMVAQKTPPNAVLSVGDKSGTVEVDPDLEGVELDDDLGAPIKPPTTGRSPAADFVSPRGNVSRAKPITVPPRIAPLKQQNPRQTAFLGSGEVEELDSGDVEALEEAPQPRLPLVPAPTVNQRSPNPANITAFGQGPGPGTRVREAVNMPAGPLTSSQQSPRATLPPPGGRPPTQPPPMSPLAPPSLARSIHKAPHVIEVTPLPPQPVSVAPVASALPTQAGIQAPQPGQGQYQVPTAAPQMRTVAIGPARVEYRVPDGPPPPLPPLQQPQVPPADARAPTMTPWGQQQQPPPQPQPYVDPNQAWQQQQMPPQPYQAMTNEAMPPPMPPYGTAPPQQLPPDMFGMGPAESGALVGGHAVAVDERPSQVPLRTGMRKTRSKLAIVIWIVVGAAVIGGGVFAGFYIRTMRLDSQVDAARERVADQQKGDTWGGWAAARDSLAGIVQAQGSLENKAALARTRALIAYELGDGLAEAKTAVDQLGGDTGFDSQVAAGYVAMASDDGGAAKKASDAALESSADDPTAIYLSGLAAMSTGDYGAGLGKLQAAYDKDDRPFFAAGLARALADTGAYDRALAVLDRAQKAYADNPALQIAKARTLVIAGRITPKAAAGAELQKALAGLVAEGAKPLGEQTRGVSPQQVALATLAQIRVHHARQDKGGEEAALKTLTAVGVDDEHFAEEMVDTLFAVGELEGARSAGERALGFWPQSKHAAILLAQILTAENKPEKALAVLAKVKETETVPVGLVTRAQAKLANKDAAGAKADYAAAIKRAPTYEPAVLGLVMLDLEVGAVDDAKAVIEKAMTGTPSASLMIAYASVLRATSDPAMRDKAATYLEKAIATVQGPELARAQLELARIYRDSGKMKEAGKMFDKAASGGDVDAKIESALLLLDEGTPSEARASLEQLAKDAGDNPRVLVELARTRMLVGDHAAAEQALDAADKTPGVTRWLYDRERGRMLFRRGDLVGAGQALSSALDGCGSDSETFFLAADAVSLDLASADPPKSPAKLGDLQAKLAKVADERLKGQPELDVIHGIAFLAANDDDKAADAYTIAEHALSAGGHPPPRLLARVQFGEAVVAYDKQNYPIAKAKLDYVVGADPTNYAALLFAADITAQTAPVEALDYARRAVTLDPASVYGWVFYGQLGLATKQPKLLDEAIAHVSQLAPGSEQEKQLKALKK